MYERILVATDGSELSERAVTHATELAASVKAELVVVRIVPRYPQTYFEGAMTMSVEDTARIEAQWAQEAQDVVNEARSKAEALGVTSRALVVKSDVISDALIATARNENVGLIVMASHGRKGIGRLLLGSETQQVLTHSHIPVLVLR